MGVLITKYPEPKRGLNSLYHLSHSQQLRLGGESESVEAEEEAIFLFDPKDASTEALHLAHASLFFISLSWNYYPSPFRFLWLRTSYDFQQWEDLAILDYDDLVQSAMESSRCLRRRFGFVRNPEDRDVVRESVARCLLFVDYGVLSPIGFYPEDEDIRALPILPTEIELGGQKYFVAANWTLHLPLMGAGRIGATLERISVRLLDASNPMKRTDILDLSIEGRQDEGSFLSVTALVRKDIVGDGSAYAQYLEHALKKHVPGIQDVRANIRMDPAFFPQYATLRVGIDVKGGDLPPLYGIDPTQLFPSPKVEGAASDIPLLFRLMEAIGRIRDR